MSVESPQLPVLTVFASNWTCDVQIDEDTAEMPFEDQAYEAATQAIEVMRGVRSNSTFQITDADNTLDVGLTMHVYPKGQDPKALHKYVESHVAFANAGFHKDAAASLAAFIVKVNKIQAERMSKLEQERHEFELLQEDLKKLKKNEPENPLNPS